MGFLSDLLGKSAKKEATKTGMEIAANLARARQQQEAALELGRTRSIADLTGGYDAAVGNLGAGTVQARTNIGDGYERGRNALTDLYGQAATRIEAGLDRSRDILSPFIARGTNADVLLSDINGVNGAAARTAAIGSFLDTQDGAMAEADRLAQKQVEAQMNARGLVNAGRGVLAGQRVATERADERVNRWIDQVTGQAARGGQYAGMLSNEEAGAAARVSGVKTGLGDRLNENFVGEGTRLADLDLRDSTALADLAYRFGSDKAGVNRWAAGGTADTIGNNTTAVNNNLNQITANRSAATTAGINNLIGLGSLAIKGFTPTVGLGGSVGPSPIGSMVAPISSYFSSR